MLPSSPFPKAFGALLLLTPIRPENIARGAVEMSPP
jgi:hypothetical protein